MRSISSALRLALRFCVFAAALIGTSATTLHASVITLSGGDAADGWVASPFTLFAYNLGIAEDRTIQSILFRGWNNVASTTAPVNGAGVTVTVNSATASFYTAPTYASPTANDTEMAQMMRRIAYNGANGGQGPLTVTMTGLEVGVSYRVDAFTYSDGVSNRANETFTYNDGTTEIFNEGNASYLVQNNVTAVGGQIVLSITSPVGGTPILSGIAVSAIPEPMSVTMLLAAAGLILARRRTRGEFAEVIRRARGSRC